MAEEAQEQLEHKPAAESAAGRWGPHTHEGATGQSEPPVLGTVEAEAAPLAEREPHNNTPLTPR